MQNAIFPPARAWRISHDDKTESRRQRACRPAAPRDRRRGPIRRLQPRTLQHRCLELPDRTDRRGRGPHRTGHPPRHPDRRGCRYSRPAARRRHLAMRPDGRRGAGHRRQQAPRPDCRLRSGQRRHHRAARHRARSTQRLPRPHGYMFMVDVSTSSRATIGGMAGNNSCGARSIRYGTMRDNVQAIDAVLADGRAFRFGELPANLGMLDNTNGYRDIAARLLGIGTREAEEIRALPAPACGASAATTSTPSFPARRTGRARSTATWRICWSARKAPSPSRPPSISSCTDPAESQGAGHLSFPDLLRGDGSDPAYRQARARPRSNWSTAQ